MSQTFFEGPEKKVEFVVAKGTPSLRSHGEATWRRVVNACGAQILSTLSNEHCDAHLLSESSLLVYDDYVVMITCGQTRLVEAMREILTFVSPESIDFLIYERKNEHFPERQTTTFHSDATQLNAWLPGRAFRFGGAHSNHIKMFCTSKPFVPEHDDPTIEMLMHGIDPSVAEHFQYSSEHGSGLVAASVGLDRILPGYTLSEHRFAPAGYSLNALRGRQYFTVHVSPEAVGSYVSFETNHNPADVNRLVHSLASMFRPTAFDVVSFLPQGRIKLEPGEYRLADHVCSELGGYSVCLFQYHLSPSGSRPAYEFSL